jgi:NAD(P)-dependent dehydrogenase (short-subunit alcohol dehydrogenase family)
VADKVALVTGGASGIGRATGLALADVGVRVVVADVDSSGGGETVELVRRAGSDAIFVEVDVADASAVAQAVERARSTFGRLDFGINAAGRQGALAETADYTEEDWSRTIAVNLSGVWLAMKYEIREMLRAGGGSIVNIASNFGLVGSPRMPAYAASKHGVVGLTKVAALEYATRGIRVNAICPGGTDTPWIERNLAADPAAADSMMEEVMALHPMRRLARPEEIAAAAVWLCSDAASYVTGAAIAVDGGFVAH